MAVNALYRTSVVRSLLPANSDQLLDVGCGTIGPTYPYADHAASVTCVDWKLRVVEPVPRNVSYLEGDFTKMALPQGTFDIVIAADVFEHILLDTLPSQTMRPRRK